MNENLNLLEVLKDCPKGIKLYSTIFGEVEFIECDNLYQIVVAKENKYYYFTLQGVFIFERIKYHTGECTLFPSKDQRDWSKFNPKNEELVPPCEFKDGDILSYKCGRLKNRTIYIYRYHERFNTAYYVALSGDTDSTFRINNQEECALNGYDSTARFATEEEKQKLFDAIKLNGYKWNAETKTLEKLVEPKFKVGDWVVFNGFTLYIKEVIKGFYRTISKGGIVNSYDWDIDNIARLWVIQDAKDGDVLANDHNILILKELAYDWSSNGTSYSVKAYCGIKPNGNFEIGKDNWCFCGTLHIHPATKEQRDALMKAMNDAGYVWDAEKKELRRLIKHKFDPNTLQVFDKVLVRLTKDGVWHATLFSHYDKEVKWGCYPFVTTSSKSYDKCIPYNEETKHLVGTAEQAPEYYRYWED